MAEETAAIESTANAELDALLGTSTAKVEGAETPKGDPDKPVTPAASPESPAETEDPLLKALEAIEEEKPAEAKPDEKPALSDDQKAILDIVPNPEIAKTLTQVAENYTAFTDALGSGKFDDVEAMLNHWNPDVMDNWKEHFYSKFVATGEWVDRFIAEAEGKGKSKDLVKLEKEVNALKNQLTEKRESTERETAQSKEQGAIQAYNKHIDSLFDQINFSKADRRWVTADLNQRIVADSKVLAAVKSGNLKAVNALFKAACREYATRDKEIVTKTAEKLELQDKKKPPLGSGGVETIPELPEDIKAVPKGQEDNWVKKQLDNLFKKK